MTIRFSCPACGANLTVADNMAGRKGKCKKCGADVAAPPVVATTAGNHQPPAGNATGASGQPRLSAPQPQAASTGTITYRCGFCRETLESDRSLAGGQDTCPSCGKATTVPQKSTVGNGSIFSKIPKWAYIVGGASILLGATFLTSWLALRDTWERDHCAELLQMSDAAIKFITKGKPEEGIAKYEAMLSLIGGRNLENQQLRQSLADAEKVTEMAKQRIEQQRRESERQQRLVSAAADQKRREADKLKTIISLESQAKAFIDSNDLQSGIDKYQQALDCIREAQSGRPEFTAAIGRIAAAGNAAQARLTAAQEEQRNLAAERARTEARLAEQARTDAENKAKGLVVREGKWVTSDEADKADFVSFCHRFLAKYLKEPPNTFAYDIKKTDSLVSPRIYVLTFVRNPKLPLTLTYHFVRTDSGLFRCHRHFMYLIDTMTETSVDSKMVAAIEAAQE